MKLDIQQIEKEQQPLLDAHSTITHKSVFNDCVFSPCGKYLVTGGFDKNIIIWDYERGLALKELLGHTTYIECIVFSHSGDCIASGDGKQIKLWAFPSGECIATIDAHDERINALAFTKDDTQLISASDDKTLKVWDAQLLSCVATLEGHKAKVTALAVASNGKEFVSGGRDQKMKVWNLQALTCTHTLYASRNKSSVEWGTMWLSLAISHDGKYLVSGNADNEILVWNFKNKHFIRRLRGGRHYKSKIRITSDSQILIYKSYSTFKAYNFKNKQRLYSFPNRDNWDMIAISPDNKEMVVYGNFSNYFIEVRDVKTGEVKRRFGPNALASYDYKECSHGVMMRLACGDVLGSTLEF